MRDIPDGVSVFVDANIFVYDILAVPEYVNSCKSFLKRIENGEIKGFTSILVISEVIHKLMFSELMERHGIKPNEVLGKMKNTPEIIASLEKYGEIVSKIGKIGIKVLPNSDKTHEKANAIIRKYKLMNIDAINAALIEEHGIENIATNDRDFERVDFLKVWKPYALNYR